MKHRTTPALLVVVALLLALNLAAQLPWPTAHAQEPQVWPPPPVEIIQISSVTTGFNNDVQRIYRLWSDGTIDYNRQYCSGAPIGVDGVSCLTRRLGRR